MKKKIALIATGLTLLFAFATAGAIVKHNHNIADTAKTEVGFRCNSCNGSGFSNGTGNTNCIFCKGTGRSSNY